MKRKTFSGLMIFVLLLGLLVSALPAGASPPIDYKPVDVGPELRAWEPNQNRISGKPSSPAGEEWYDADAAADYPCYSGITKTWLSLDNTIGLYIWVDFHLISESSGAQLWVQDDLSWPAGDPRPTPIVTCDQAEYLIDEFDTNMYPVETDFFGMPDFHDGTNSLLEAWGLFPPGTFYDEDGRQVVLVSNIRDDSYYDPDYPNYIAGFYSPSFEAYFDRNIMSIDAYDWANRVGPDGSRPYLYEGVFAHEYQHLLHSDFDSDEDELVNEGLAMFAEYLTGYVIGDDAYSTFQENPENSLPVWGDQGGEEIVADYGLVFLFHMYLYEKFGQEFIQYEFHNPDNGISSINSTLEAFNKQTDFGELYHDFSVAVLIDSKKAGYRYGFKALDVEIDIGTADAPNPEAYDTPGAPPWGADYIWIDGDPKELAKFTFNGVDFSTFPTAWTSDGDMLYSGTGNLIDNWAIFEATGGGTLTFDTYWDIEDYWDFGFVQVSTDGGNSWVSLENAYTTYDHDPSAHPNIIANLPGLTGWSCYYAAPPCLINVSYDLSAYSGDILLAFRYMTDWATLFEGWYVDNVYVDGELISDGTDASIFMDITELFPVNNDFTVTFVGIKEKRKGNQYKVHTMKLDDVTEDGLFELNKVLNWSDSAVMLVTFDAPEGFTGYANYTYDFTYTNAGPKK
jgi:hypothetical protein